MAAAPTPAVHAAPHNAERDVAEQGSDAFATIKALIAEVAHDVRTRGEGLAEAATSLVAARPLAAVAIAFGGGYVAMRIATSKLTQVAVVGGLLYVTAGLLRKSTNA